MTDTIDISVVRERFHGRQDGIRAGASNAPYVDGCRSSNGTA